MKVLKNSLKLKALSKKHLLLIVVVIIIAAVLSFQIVNHIQQQPKDVYAILQKQRFVFVQNQDDLDQGNNAGAGFDLHAENLFVSYSTVIKNNKLYGKSGVYTTKGFYNRALNGGISSILLNLKVTPEEIKKHHFQIERDPESLVNKKFLKEKYPPEFELQYKYREKNQFSKVRITYKKVLNGILGSYIHIHSKIKLNLTRSWMKKSKLLKKFKKKMRVIDPFLQ